MTQIATHNPKQIDLKAIAQSVLDKAAAKGAEQAEVSASHSNGFNVTVRKEAIETVEHNNDKGFDITVYFGKHKGSASSTDLSEEALDTAIEKACNIAKYTAEDDCVGLADKDLLAFEYPDLELYHPANLTTEAGIEIAMQCERKGLSDERITNTEGASFASHTGHYVYANSLGFAGDYHTSRHDLSCVLLAEDQKGKERDYSYTVARDKHDLRSAEDVANEAIERTVRRLGARRVKTQTASVLLSPELSRGLLGNFVSAVSGSSLYRKASFLVDSVGKQLFPDFVTMVEQPHLPKALGSVPFDREGVRTSERTLVENGVLQGYVMGSYSARKLGLQTTGNAGGVHNLQITTNGMSQKDLMQEMGTGFYVTELMGFGINLVTGDYSHGASGFWVENGEIQYAVSEVTIASNLADMFKGIRAVANDVDRRGKIHSGSILINEMMIAGD